MTYSLVARSADGAELGAATASKYLAVGATVPAVSAGHGALVTQAHTNVAFREEGLALLRAGVPAEEAVQILVQGDAGRARRQLAVLGTTGEPAVWTGELCSEAAGHLVGTDCVAIGNLMAGATVLEAMVEAFTAAPGKLAERLLLALAAGERAGGDRRGRQSAAVLVLGAGDHDRLRSPARTDLRVDDHPEPVAELRRLLELHRVVVSGPERATALPLDGETAAEVDRLLQVSGHAAGGLVERLSIWAHSENLEHRLLADAVDAAVLERLRDRAGGLRRPAG